MTKRFIHVNRNVIHSNTKRDENAPPLVLRGRSSKPIAYGHDIAVYYDGNYIGKFTYNKKKPLSCGARCWFEVDDPKVELKVTQREEEES